MRIDELTKLYTFYVESGFDVEMARDYLKCAERKGDVVYKKPWESFRERDERDLFAHVALHRHGIKFTVRAEDAPDGYSNIDLKFRASLWELKVQRPNLEKTENLSLSKATLGRLFASSSIIILML